MPKKYVVSVMLAAAFFTVLLFNAYFNLTSGVAINENGSTLEEKFYLSGPDPYYNMRLVEETLKTGHYPYMGGAHGGKDPLLNYPLGGSGGRPPLFNMMAIGVGSFLSLFMNEVDALGYAMQLLPSIYGALLVIPVYLIGKHLFNRKVGIIAAWIIPLIPVHLSSGHGSSYALFDTDSMILLIVTTTLLFLILSMKEKDYKKSVLLAVFAGIFAAALNMVWVAGEYIFVLVAIYAILQMFVNIIAKRSDRNIVFLPLILLIVGYAISFPVIWIKKGFSLTPHLAAILGVVIFGLVYIWLEKKNIPWLISIPSIAGVIAVSLAFLYLIKDTTISFLKPLSALANIVFKGVYANKVSLTIAEASGFDFSRTVMSFGPVIYWLGLLGFLYLIYRYYKKGWKSEYMVLITWFVVESWLLSKAGRFINDLVPSMAIFSGVIIWYILDKLKIAEMVKNFKGIGGGWYAIKRTIKLRHVFGVAFIAFFVIFPNGWLAFDAAIPSNMKKDFNTDKMGAFGLGVHTEEYWTDAFTWLHEQTGNMNTSSKPGFISWWDYGFYCVAVAKNPTVADNFQEGIEPAANFQTAQSEKEAVTVLITRLAEYNMYMNGGKISDDLRNVFSKYLGNESSDLVTAIEDPKGYRNTTYDKVIGAEYGGKKYHVRLENARYHDATNILMRLSDSAITMLYRDVENVTGRSVRYYGVEGYDINIFNVFTFLADKGVYGYETPEDDYFKLWYIANNTGQKFTPDEVKNITQSMSREDINKIYGTFKPYTERKEPFYQSMVYRTYLGDFPKSIFENYSTDPRAAAYMRPTAGMKHFYAQYVSPVTNDKPFYFVRASMCFGFPAVVIAKYYEGAIVKGVIKSEGQPVVGANVTVEQNVTMFGTNVSIPHDNVLTDSNGRFKLIVPAGNVMLHIYQNENGQKVDLKKVYIHVTEEQATRKTNWTIDLGTINIEKGELKGIVYWDKDGDGSYNASIDQKIDAQVKIGDNTVSTHNGVYDVKHLLPSVYTVTAIKSGYDVKNRESVEVKPNATVWHNISMVPSKVQVSGMVWYDKNGNGVRDENEAIANIPIIFTVTSSPDKNANNDTVMSNSTGYYSVNLSPAYYSIKVSYNMTEGNETKHYIYSGTIHINIGDSAKTLNIRLRED